MRSVKLGTSGLIDGPQSHWKRRRWHTPVHTRKESRTLARRAHNEGHLDWHDLLLRRPCRSWRQDRCSLECIDNAVRANKSGDAIDVDEASDDTCSEEAPDEDWDDDGNDEREVNEAPIAKKLPVIRVHKRISRLTTETQRMLIGAGVPFYQR